MARNANKDRQPKIGRHSSGQARVKLSGKTYYLGPYDRSRRNDSGPLHLDDLTVKGRRRYDDLVERWIMNDRLPLHPASTCAPSKAAKA